MHLYRALLSPIQSIANSQIILLFWASSWIRPQQICFCTRVVQVADASPAFASCCNTNQNNGCWFSQAIIFTGTHMVPPLPFVLLLLRNNSTRLMRAFDPPLYVYYHCRYHLNMSHVMSPLESLSLAVFDWCRKQHQHASSQVNIHYWKKCTLAYNPRIVYMYISRPWDSALQ
jgi:hypothetical protein